MKKRVVSAAVLALAAGKASAQAVYEPFDYGAAGGTNLATSNTAGYVNPMNGLAWFNATATGQTTPVTLTNSSLDISGLAASAGGSIAITANSASVAARIGIQPAAFTGSSSFANGGTTLYYSLVLDITDMTGFSSTAPNALLAGFNNTVGTQGTIPGAVGARLYVTSAGPTTFKIAVGNNAATPTTALTYSTETFSTNTPIFIVGGYTINGGGVGGSDDTHSLWINPTPGAAVAPAATLTQSGSDIATSLLSFVATTGANKPAGVQIDELRIDQSWSQVTPGAGTNWGGGSGNWSSSLPNSAGSFVNFNSGGGAVNVDSPQTAGTINIKSSNSYTIGGSAITLDAGNAAGTSAINVQAQMNTATSGAALPASHAITANVVLNNFTEATIGTAQALTISGNVSGAGNLLKGGVGTLSLTGNNSGYSGLITINNGAVAISGDASLGAVPANPTTNVMISGSGAPIGNGSTLRFLNSFGLDPNRTILLGTPTLGVANVNAGSGGGVFDTAGNDVTIAGLVTTVTSPAAATQTSGTATAGGAVVKMGAGTLSLTNTGNTFFGMFIQGGVLNVALNGTNDGALGTVPATSRGLIVLQGGTLQFGGSGVINSNRFIQIDNTGGAIDTMANTVTFNGAISPLAAATGGLAKLGSGTLVMGNISTGGATSYTGPTTFTGGIVSISRPTDIGSTAAAVTTNYMVFNGGTLQVTNTLINNRAFIVNPAGGTIDSNLSTTTNGITLGGGNATFNGNLSFTNSGVSAGVVTVNRTGGTVTVTPGSALNVASGATLTITGNTFTSDGTNNLGIVNNGKVNINSVQPVMNVSGTGNLTVGATGVLTASAITQNLLSLNGGGAKVAIRPNGTSSGLSVVNGLSIGDATGASSQLDMNDNDMIVNYTAGNSPIVSIGKLLKSGYNGGTWDGNGIASTIAHSTPGTALGYADAGDVGIGTFDGTAIASNAVLIKYTFTGDSSLDGKVDLGNDFDLFLQGYIGGGSTWVAGDYNYDGKVDDVDFGMFVDGIKTQGSTPLGELDALISTNPELSVAQKASLLAVVPEPASVGLVCAAGLVGMSRRRRRA